MVEYKMAINYIYWKRKRDKRFKKLGIAFKDERHAILEAVNIAKRNCDVKIKSSGKYWFDSRKL